MSMFKNGPRTSAPQPPSRQTRKGGTLTRPLSSLEDPSPPPVTSTPPPPQLPSPGPPPLPNPPPPPTHSPSSPPAISPRQQLRRYEPEPKPEYKAVIKVSLPVEFSSGFISVSGHTNMSMNEVIAAAMTKFYKGQGVAEEGEEMKILIRNACGTLALSIDKALMPRDELLDKFMDPKVDPKIVPMLKFEFRLVRTREVTEEERRAVESAKQAKAVADIAAQQEAKDKEAAELADSQDDTKFEGPQTATIDELIARLLDSSRTELEMRSAFCLNYVNFMSPVALIAKIKEYYDRPLSTSGVSETGPRAFFLTKQRILEFVKTWAEEFPEDFKVILEEDDGYKPFLVNLATTDSVTSDPVIKNAVAICGPTYTGLTDLIDTVKIKIHYILKNRVSRVTAVVVPLILLEYPIVEIPADRMGLLLSAPLDEIVAQFNRMDYNCLSLINLRELTNKWWTRKQVEKCPNVTRMIDIYNQRSYWVASACLTSPKPEERAHCISLFIKLSRALLNAYNYFGANAILNGLLQSPIGPTRIKATWDKVSANKKNILEEIKVECDRKKNFAAYRTAYAQASLEEKPCIPNLVVVLQDLYQLEELPTVVENSGHINWHKYGKEWRQAQKLVLKQIKQPALHVRVMTVEQERESRRLGSVLVTVLTHCRLDEEKLWDLSYIHEAKSEEHKLSVQWKGYTAEQKQAVHEEELKKVWAVWGPILELRRQRFDKEKALREEENAKLVEAMKKLNVLRSEWQKDEKRGGTILSKPWNDPSHCADVHVLPDYLAPNRPSSRPHSVVLPDDMHHLSVDGLERRESGTESPLPEGRSMERRESSRTQRTPLSPGESPENSVNSRNI